MNRKSNFSRFMLIWAGEFISAIGSGLTSFGLSVYVFSQTESAADMAFVTLAAFLPIFLLSVPAGVLAGISMIGFGFRENIYVICLFGFLFFAMLPFANNCLDYLVRTNIPDQLQGRAWGMIGFLSQIGYVASYGGAGMAADGIAAQLRIGVGRGSAVVIMAAGILLSITAVLLYSVKSVRSLEKKVNG